MELMQPEAQQLYVFALHCNLLKGKFTPKSEVHIFPLTCRAIYQSRLLWCELQSVGDNGRKDVRLLSNIMELEGSRLATELANITMLASSVALAELAVLLISVRLAGVVC